MLSRDAVALTPGTDSVDGNAAVLSNLALGCGGDDLGVGSHRQIMHFALSNSKRLLHYETSYANRMTDTPNARLRIAREKAGYATATDAAEALGISRSTYIGHENGHRGFPAKKAPLYARRFKVDEQWLLFGKGEGPTGKIESPNVPTLDELARMLAEAQEEIGLAGLETLTIGGYPRAVAANLRTHLLRFSGVRPSDSAAASEPSKGQAEDAQSPPPTKRSARG